MNRSTKPSRDPEPCLPPEGQADARRIAALHSYAILDTPREPEFDDIVQMAAQACATPMAHINFIDASRQWIKAAVGHDVQEMPLHLGFCTDALAECDILLLPDLVADPERAENPLVTGAPHLRFYAGVPLKTPDGLAIGTLCVLDRVPRTLNDQQLFILKALARTVMAQLETRRSDAASRRSEARYHALFNSIDAGFCIIEMRFDAFGQPVDYRFVAVNAAFEEQTNLKDAAGRWMRDLAPDHEQHWFDTFGRVATTGESTRFENAAEALGRWYDVQAYRIDEPASHRVAVLFNDISDRRRMELALRARESELRLIADAMPVLIAFVDRSFTYRFANAAYENWFGRSPEAIIGRPVMEMLDADEFEVRRPYMEQAFVGSEVRIERSWPWPDGRARVAEIRYLPRRDPDGQIGGFYVFVQDITERKHDEQRLVSRAERLEGMVAAQRRDRDRVWTLSPVLKVVAARDGRVQSVNPSWTHALGWSEAETVGRSVIEFVPAEEREQAVADLRGVVLGLPAKDIEVSVATKETGTRRISWTIVPEDDLLYGFGRDITEQRQAEEALRQSQKLEAVGQLTGGVAHDFNNLLTIIRSSVDFLRRPELPEERKRRYLDAVSDTVDRAAKLTGQLLAFARRQALKPEVFEVGARLRSVADMLDTIAGTRIRIVTQVPEEPCFVRADLSQFETALVNMAVNARDAMDGEGTLRLRLTAARDMPAIRGHAGASGPFAAIALTDTGTGIASDQIGRVFEPFFTTKEVGRGTGLGLSQVFGFAKQSGGDVSVESAVGEGATFTLYLPEIQSEVRRDQDIKHDLDFAAVGTGQRLLVVEDNVEVGRFATQILQDLGYETTWAVNAEEALDKLGTDGSGFDLVFSDVVMPGMGGIALAKELRRRLPDLPVVLASGYSHVLAQDDAHGFELLHKPYSAEQLSRILQRVAQVAEPSRTT